MEIVGRITKDAVVHQLKDERQVVNFTIAINDYYKGKGSTEGKYITTYVHCAYWMKSKIAECLKKGTIAELQGRLYITAYTDLNREAKGTLNCHVNNIKVHFASKEKQLESRSDNEQNITSSELKDDLPF